MAGMSGVALAKDGRGGNSGPRYGGHSSVGVGVVVNPYWFSSGYYPSPYYYPRAYYAPYYYPPYYYSPYYYPPSVVTIPTEPPVYIEREEVAEPAPEATAYWYYCADPQGYYPDVKQCPGGWQAVPPQPQWVRNGHGPGHRLMEDVPLRPEGPAGTGIYENEG